MKSKKKKNLTAKIFAITLLVIMVGSVFVKGSNDTLVNEFEKLVDKYTNKKCSFVKLTVPPATGAVIWALELATGTYPNEKIRDLITNHVQMKLKEIES